MVRIRQFPNPPGDVHSGNRRIFIGAPLNAHVTVGADSIRPQPRISDSTRLNETSPVNHPLGFPRGEDKGCEICAFTIQRTTLSRQLRADATRPYN